MIVTDHLKRSTRKHRASHPQTLPYSILLRVRFTLPISSPKSRWALTPPFHHCLSPAHRIIGCMFSVALSVGSLRLGVTQHPALWSSDFPPASHIATLAIIQSASTCPNAYNVLQLSQKFVKRKAKKWQSCQFSEIFRLTEAETSIYYVLNEICGQMSDNKI